MIGKELDSTERITMKYRTQEEHEMGRMKGLAAILGVLVLMVVVTACGSGESSTTPATNSSATFFENASGNTGASQAANEPDTEPDVVRQDESAAQASDIAHIALTAKQTGLPVESVVERATAFNWFIVIAAVSVGLGVLGTIFWVWMLVDCATKEPEEGNSKVVWTIIIVFTHLVGAAIYFFVRRPQRRAEADGC